MTQNKESKDRQLNEIGGESGENLNSTGTLCLVNQITVREKLQLFNANMRFKNVCIAGIHQCLSKVDPLTNLVQQRARVYPDVINLSFIFLTTSLSNFTFTKSRLVYCVTAKKNYRRDNEKGKREGEREKGKERKADNIIQNKIIEDVSYQIEKSYI